MNQSIGHKNRIPRPDHQKVIPTFHTDETKTTTIVHIINACRITTKRRSHVDGCTQNWLLFLLPNNLGRVTLWRSHASRLSPPNTFPCYFYPCFCDVFLFLEYGIYIRISMLVLLSRRLSRLLKLTRRLGCDRLEIETSIGENKKLFLGTHRVGFSLSSWRIHV